MIGLALTLGWARSTEAEGPEVMFRSRYAVLAVPIWCGVYFVGLTYEPRLVGRVLCGALFIFTCVVAQGSYREGLIWGRRTRAVYERFEADLKAGMPINLLAETHFTRIHIPFHPDARREIEGLGDLAQAGGRWTLQVQAPVPFRAVELPPVPSQLSDMTFENGVGVTRGPESSMTFVLKEPIRVGVVRLNLSMYPQSPTAIPAAFQVRWRALASGPVANERTIDAAAGQQIIAIWVNDTIDRFEIRPDDKPCVITISGIVLLSPIS
jgi:hypothetical protein